MINESNNLLMKSTSDQMLLDSHDGGGYDYLLMDDNQLLDMLSDQASSKAPTPKNIDETYQSFAAVVLPLSSRNQQQKELKEREDFVTFIKQSEN